MHLLAVEQMPPAGSSRIYDERTHVIQAETADEGLSILRHETFDLVIVDITTLSEEGFSFIRRLRLAKNDTPLVALTGHHCDDRVRALGLGADDAIAQPIDNEELQARITAVIRRYKGHSQSLLQLGNLSLSIDTREVSISGRRVKLTRKEYSMLELLVLQKGHVVTKNMFLNHLYKNADEADTKTIKVFICKLRKMLHATGADGVITTVRGKGYALRKTGMSPLWVSTADGYPPRELGGAMAAPLTPRCLSQSPDWSEIGFQAQSRWDELPPARSVRSR
jgi:two-component system cell cycle response regulator CtrA